MKLRWVFIITYVPFFFFAFANAQGTFANEETKTALAYLTELNYHKIPVLYASCNTTPGKAILIFPIGQKQGVLMEMRSKSWFTTYVPVYFHGASLQFDFEKYVNGGNWTYTVLQNRIQDLAQGEFSLYSSNMLALTSMPAKSTCPDKPPEYDSK